jgi:hypothetical protein
MICLNSSLFPTAVSPNPIDMSTTYGYAPRYAELKSAKDFYEGGFCVKHLISIC